jgi:signal transduction histidine kinase
VAVDPLGPSSSGYTVEQSGSDDEVERRVKRWMARELHDTVAQILTTMLVEMEQYKVDQAGRQSVLEEFDHLAGSTRAALNQIRGMLRTLREEPRHEFGFLRAVEDLLSAFAERTGIRTTLCAAADWPSPLNGVASYNLQRIIQESLANVRAHSGATTVNTVLGVGVDGRARLEIQDNGTGIVFLGNEHAGMGVAGIRERVAILGGEVNIRSAYGVGTTVSVTVPADYLS